MAAAVAAAEALEKARRGVAAAADALLARPCTKQLDESLGAKDWRRVRAELFAAAHGAGADWLAALEFVGNIPGQVAYAANLVTAFDITGAPPAEMPHVRHFCRWSACNIERSHKICCIRHLSGNVANELEGREPVGAGSVRCGKQLRSYSAPIFCTERLIELFCARSCK